MPKGGRTGDGRRVIRKEGHRPPRPVKVGCVRALTRHVCQPREPANSAAVDTAKRLADEQEQRVLFDVDTVVVAAFVRRDVPVCR